MKRQNDDGTFCGQQDATIFTATKNFAEDIRWVFKAASTDDTRAVLCKTICICRHADKQWAVATDGKRIHAIKLNALGVSDGVYHLLMSTPSRVVAIKDVDAVYPSWHQAVPVVTEIKKQEMFRYQGNPSEKQQYQFRLAVQANKLNGANFNMQYLLDAADGMLGDFCIQQENQYSPILFTKNGANAFTEDRFAAVMSLRF